MEWLLANSKWGPPSHPRPAGCPEHNDRLSRYMYQHACARWCEYICKKKGMGKVLRAGKHRVHIHAAKTSRGENHSARPHDSSCRQQSRGKQIASVKTGLESLWSSSGLGKRRIPRVATIREMFTRPRFCPHTSTSASRCGSPSADAGAHR